MIPAQSSTLATASARAEVLRLLDRMTGTLEGSMETSIDGLHLHRLSQPVGPSPLSRPPRCRSSPRAPSCCWSATKPTSTTLPLPDLVGGPAGGRQGVGGQPEPALPGLRLDLHPEAITALISDENLPPAPPSDTSRALSVNPLDDTLLDALLRLLRLLDTPRDIPFLAPMIKRELLYRLMMDGQGAALRQTVLQDSQLNRVAKAIRILRDNYAQPLRVEDIARDVHMSVSSLHHHFKQATAMSPLQYQKHLRLQEARRIMLADDAGVALAAHAVGYESSSQFSREYSRLFGAPLRDKQRWRDEATQAPA